MEFLKEIVGDELYKQLEEKLKGNEKVQLINAKDGTFIPKAKFDQTNDEVKSLKDQLKERDAQLKTLGDAKEATDDLKAKIAELQNANKTAKTEHDAAMAKIKMDYALQMALKDAKDPKEVMPHLDLTKIKINDDGTLSGMKEQLDPLIEKKAYLFNTPGGQPEGGTGGGINPPGAPGAGTTGDEYAQSYKKAIERGDTMEAVRIKQEAFSKGIGV